MDELKTIERDELKLLKLIKTPVLMWRAERDNKTMHVAYKNGVIDDPRQVLAVGDVLEDLELNGTVLIGVLITQRIADLAIFSCASSSSINTVLMMVPVEPKRTFWERLHHWYLDTF